MSVQTSSISSDFIWRRVHSLMGLWLVLYLIVHLITNSQAALWFGDDGSGFVKMVNALETLPYLQVVETVLIGIPLLIHGVWGVKRALTAKSNSSGGNGSRPGLKYSRNRAFTWQRLSSWILLVGIIGHVVQMRFLDAPKKAMSPAGEQYFVKLHFDEGLYTLAARLHVNLFSPEDVESAAKQVKTMGPMCLPRLGHGKYNADEDSARMMVQKAQEEKEWMAALASYKLKDREVVAVSSMPGTAFLLMVRDTFKSPVMAVLYTIFLLAAAFHAFNGFWTFLITWGMILSYRSQRAMVSVSLVGMAVLSLLGLAAIWCSYWVNLRY
jgi:succinate dehydrogenase / fumarate reductase cytochrome b subunit